MCGIPERVSIIGLEHIHIYTLGSLLIGDVFLLSIFYMFHCPFGLVLQLLCSPIGNRNYRKKTEQNIANEWTPQIVHWPDLHHVETNLIRHNRHL